MRKALCTLGVLLVTAVASGCGGDDNGGGDSGSSAAAGGDSGKDAVRIGAIMEARPQVEPWSAAWHDSLEKAKKADGAIEFKEAYNGYQPTQAEPLVRQMLSQDYGTVLFTTFTLNDIARPLAERSPDVPMMVTSFDQPQDPNLSIVTASYLQIGYSTCWLLTRLSKSGTVGYIGSQPVPFDQEILKGCEIGLKAADPDAKLIKGYTNDFVDLQKNQAQMQALLDRGADQIYLSSGTEDVVGGFRLCEQKKINCATWGSDIRKWAPTTGVFSAILDWSGYIQRMVDARRAGKPFAERFSATYDNKALVPQPFDGETGKRVPADVQKEFDEVVADLAAGRIELPESEAHPGLP
jgi:basic membrane lipoprotein Med (substrate-binding protein (PBP1-ABC) superfamily)